MLTSIGALYMYGVFDGQRIPRISLSLTRLEFPPAYPRTTNTNYEPSTAIKQYSVGRSSVLGLADDGKIWMWQSYVGYQIKPMHVGLAHNRVKRVVAGNMNFEIAILGN